MSSSSPCLTVLGGLLTGNELRLEDEVDNVLIGSDPSCRFCLEAPGVSPIHARLWVDRQGITVYDTNAPQGLFVNDDRVVGQALLHNGDILWLGPPGRDDVVMIQCRIPPRAAAAGATPVPSSDMDETAIVPPGLASAPTFVSAEDEPSAQTVVLGTTDETAFVPLIATPPPPPLVSHPLDAEPATDSTWVMPPPPPLPTLPPLPGDALPPVAAMFEDDIETVMQLPAPVPPPPPVVVPPTPPPVPTMQMAPPQRPVAPAARSVAPPPVRPVPSAKPAPRAAGAAPAPAVRRTPKAKSGGGGWIALVAVLLIVVVGGGVAGWYFLLGPGASKPTPTPPVTVAQAPTPVAEVPTPLPSEVLPSAAPSEVPVALPTPEPTVAAASPTPGPTPTPSPSAKPSPSPSAKASAKPTPPPSAPDPALVRAQQVAALLAQADGALGERRYDAASTLYDQVLQLDAQNAAAQKGKASAHAALQAARHSLVAGRSSLIGAKTDKTLKGFESDDVSLSKAPDYSGRLDFEASPKNPKPGDNYSVKVLLTNDGKKPFKVSGMTVTTTTNGDKAGGAVAPGAREIQPQQQALLHEATGVWRENVSSWIVEVQVQSSHGETVRNTIAWR